jgi:hypothetical protein
MILLGLGTGFKRLRENDHLGIESRRACPELVERGRLNLAQDAVLGWHAPWKSSAGTTEKLSRHGPGIGERIGNSQPRNIVKWKCLALPPGNFQSSLRDFSSLESLPRTASWAEFSHTCPN